jgi:DNA-binding transcriptional LysR family regulator
VLTAEGQRLLAYADAVETTVQSASEQFGGGASSLSGHVRVGTTEGFGCFSLSAQLSYFPQSIRITPARWLTRAQQREP